MTLEGEYYFEGGGKGGSGCSRRNPHDIGRRILRYLLNNAAALLLCRNPHDIGRRILHKLSCNDIDSLNVVAILMTLEGEYYVIPLQLSFL